MSADGTKCRARFLLRFSRGSLRLFVYDSVGVGTSDDDGTALECGLPYLCVRRLDLQAQAVHGDGSRKCGLVGRESSLALVGAGANSAARVCGTDDEKVHGQRGALVCESDLVRSPLCSCWC